MIAYASPTTTLFHYVYSMKTDCHDLTYSCSAHFVHLLDFSYTLWVDFLNLYRTMCQTLKTVLSAIRQRAASFARLGVRIIHVGGDGKHRNGV